MSPRPPEASVTREETGAESHREQGEALRTLYSSPADREALKQQKRGRKIPAAPSASFVIWK